MAKKKEVEALQKLTELQDRFDAILDKPKVTRADIGAANFTPEEQTIFERYLALRMNAVTGLEHEEFLLKIDDVISDTSRNQMWEHNHAMITAKISKFIEKYGQMPTKQQIATETGLSRQTVGKHIKEFKNHSLYQNEVQKFEFMADRILSKIYKIAVTQDNIKACRLFLEATGRINSNPGADKITNIQNHYILINHLKITQESLQQLEPEQLNQLEQFLSTIIKQPEAAKAQVTNFSQT